MNITEEIRIARAEIQFGIDVMADNAKFHNHEARNSLARSAGQYWRQAKARQRKGKS